MPAICRPELKMYWFVVPDGQKPPPPVGELKMSVQTLPWLSTPHCTRFACNTAFGPEFRLNGLLARRAFALSIVVCADTVPNKPAANTPTKANASALYQRRPLV